MEVLPPRKRIVARELTEAELQSAREAAPAESAAAPQDDPHAADFVENVERVPAINSIDYVVGGGGNVITIETDAAPTAPSTFSETVIDPTAFSARHRKHHHALVYRWTQVVLLASSLVAIGGVVAWAMQRSLGGRLCALGSLLLASVAFLLTRRVKLTRRLRGYAVAAMIVAVIVLAANLGLRLGGSGGGGAWHPQRAVERSPQAPRR